MFRLEGLGLFRAQFLGFRVASRIGAQGSF